MSEFNGMIVARIAVDNYDLEDVRQKVGEKLSELDFVVATLIGVDEMGE